MKRLLIAVLSYFLATSILMGREAVAEVRKPVVSIDDIKDLANTGQADALRQMIETTIVNTGKFRIMERGAQGMGNLVREQQMAKSRLVTSNTPGKIGGFEGVDFKVYGTITTAAADVQADSGRKTKEELARKLKEGGGLIGILIGSSLEGSANCNTTTASLAIDIRITDASTGELKYSKTITQTDGSKSCDGKTHLDLSSLMRTASQRISMGLVTIMYPVKVVDVDDDGSILLNYGEGLLAKGDVYSLFNQGREIVDPDTHAVLGHKESFVGLVRVVEVTPKFSKATPLTTLSAPPAPGIVAREATPEQLHSLPHGSSH
jgi:curli biogenesis system outer membrane secretion channel CsgG